MKLYEQIKTTALILEKARSNYIRAIEEVRESNKFTQEYKSQLIDEVVGQYKKDVSEANKKVSDLVKEFYNKTTPKEKESNLLNLSNVLALINNLHTQLTDDELYLITKDFNTEYNTMELLKRELETRNLMPENYEKTFKSLNLKSELNAALEPLKGFEENYFSENLNSTCIKYSLDELKDYVDKIDEIQNVEG